MYYILFIYLRWVHYIQNLLTTHSQLSVCDAQLTNTDKSTHSQHTKLIIQQCMVVCV